MAVLSYPIATEKAISMIERDNVIVYVVDSRATKIEIKKEFEALFKVKVRSVSTARTPRNTKKAFIRIAPQFKASDIALKLKLV
jgi:ribosomal protein L23